MPNHLETTESMHTLMKTLSTQLPTKLPSTVTGVGVDGATYTPQALADKITQLDTPYAAAVKADQDKVAADQAVAAVDKTTRAFMGKAVGALKALFGKNAPALTDLGIEPDKVPVPLTAEQKVAKAAKANATRQARGTKGKRQKEKIHGTVPAAPMPPATPPKTGV